MFVAQQVAAPVGAGRSLHVAPHPVVPQHKVHKVGSSIKRAYHGASDGDFQPDFVLWGCLTAACTLALNLVCHATAPTPLKPLCGITAVLLPLFQSGSQVHCSAKAAAAADTAQNGVAQQPSLNGNSNGHSSAAPAAPAHSKVYQTIQETVSYIQSRCSLQPQVGCKTANNNACQRSVLSAHILLSLLHSQQSQAAARQGNTCFYHTNNRISDYSWGAALCTAYAVLSARPERLICHALRTLSYLPPAATCCCCCCYDCKPCFSLLCRW
jgi:hypothetical protein